MLKTGQAWSGLVVCKDATGAITAPSVGPAGVLYVNGTANGAGVTISGANPYKWTVTLPALTAGDCVSMYITATISTIATASVVAEDVGDAVRLSDFILNSGTSPVAGAVNQITLAASALAVAGSYVHNMIAIVGGTGIGQARLITAYTAGRVATVVPNFDTTPANDSIYVVLPIGQSYVNSFAAGAIDATAIANGAIDSATFALGAIDEDAIAANAITSSELAASAVQEIADQVWDELIAGHVIPGSTAATLTALAPGAAIVLNSEITEIHTT